MDADAWDARYAAAELVWSAEPNRFVAEEVAGLPAGRAVDLACGEGRNALWLARRGWTVTAVDFSTVALDKGRTAAAAEGLALTWVAADVTQWVAPAASCDLALVCYLQLPAEPRRAALRHAWDAVPSGGSLLVVAHDARNLAEGAGGPQDPSVLYGPGDVLADVGVGGDDPAVVRADTVRRPVEGATRPALDCLVRLRRP